jgi:hypothetical protein
LLELELLLPEPSLDEPLALGVPPPPDVPPPEVPPLPVDDSPPLLDEPPPPEELAPSPLDEGVPSVLLIDEEFGGPLDEPPPPVLWELESVSVESGVPAVSVLLSVGLWLLLRLDGSLPAGC